MSELNSAASITPGFDTNLECFPFCVTALEGCFPRVLEKVQNIYTKERRGGKILSSS